MAEQVIQPVQLKADRFKTGGSVYPADLMTHTAEYGGNWVQFNINVHEDSYLNKDGSGNQIRTPITSPNNRGAIQGTNVSGAAQHVIIDGMAAGAANALNPVGRAGNAVGVPLNDGVATAGNMVLGVAVAEAAIAAVGGLNKGVVRTEDTICLYMPNDLSIRYGAVWDEVSLDTTLAMMAAAEALGTAAAKGVGGAAVGALAGAALGGKRGAVAGGALGAAVGLGTSGANLGQGAQALVGQALNTPGVGQFVSKSSGVAANPKKEQLFKEVRFRDFSFTYQFFPRSPSEAKAVLKIIKTFKLHMHPEYKDAQQFLYIYPSEFEISYYSNGAPSTVLPKHTSCVLTDMSVLYAPQGVYSTFADGSPTQINITLSFRELGVLTKKDIEAGF